MSADLETETYLKTQQVRERYGRCSTMWIERRMEDRGFPKPVYFGALRFWRVSELVVWDAEQIKASSKPAPLTRQGLALRRVSLGRHGHERRFQTLQRAPRSSVVQNPLSGIHGFALSYGMGAPPPRWTG